MVDTVTQRMEDVVSAAKLANWDATNAATSPQVREGVRLIDAFAKINAAPPMPHVPAVVLSADKPFRIDLLPPDVKQDETGHASTTGSPRWTGWRSTSMPSTSRKPNSGHDIYLYSPALVVDAIRDVVDDVH